MSKNKKIVIFDNLGNPSSEYPLPDFVDESLENGWAKKLFGKFRKQAKNNGKVDSWEFSKNGILESERDKAEDTE